jgi:anaerobic selenocysteine-containing dehydrogenase
MPLEHQYMRNWNKGYLDFSKENALRQKNDPIMIAIYSDILQRFRLASTGKRPGAQPPPHLKERIYKYFDPLPFWYPPLEDQVTDLQSIYLKRHYPAPNGDVPLLGFTKCLAAPDS